MVLSSLPLAGAAPAGGKKPKIPGKVHRTGGVHAADQARSLNRPGDPDRLDESREPLIRDANPGYAMYMENEG